MRYHYTLQGAARRLKKTPNDVLLLIQAGTLTAEEKVKGMYLLLKDEIESKSGFRLSSRHREILDAERDTHKKGLSRSFSLEASIAFAK
jgi:hypothetical protein